MKSADQRCCGSGVCIINEAGECWCGQVWDGEKMVHPPLKMTQLVVDSSDGQQKDQLIPNKPQKS